MATIDDTIQALEDSQNALRTLDHHHRMAAVLGMDALGLDENGRLRYDRFEDGGNGAKVVARAANDYLNSVLQQRFYSAAGTAVDFNKLAPDELARLQIGYFGMTSQDISRAASELKENFTPEAVQKVFEQQIELARQAIRVTPLTQAGDLDKDEVLSYVGLSQGNPLYGHIIEDVKPVHLMNLLDVFRREKAVTERALRDIGIYNP